MANKILHKRNLSTGNNPTTASLEPGELAINVADGTLFLRQSGSVANKIINVGESASFAATASYVNPLNQNVQLTGSLYLSTPGVASIYFTGSGIPGQLTWNDTDGTLELGLKGGVVKSELGQDLVTRVVNKTVPNVDLSGSNYQVVVVSGAQGQRLAVKLAQADSDANSAGTLGIIAEDIAKNQEGFIVTVGLLKNRNTTGALQGETWSDGDVLYLSPTTAGAITNIKPQAPQHTVIVGYVEYAHANNGKIYVKIDNGYELDELHNVQITTASLANGQLLVRSASVWINTNQLTGSYGLTGSLTATQITASGLYAGNTYVSGSLTVLNGATIFGSSSFQYVTSSQLAVSASFISVNVFEPIERFGGLKVYDSGSSTATASLAWDSLHNHWVYQNVDGATYTGGILLAGPRNTGSLGDEPNLIQYFIPRSDGGDHLDNSQIYSSGSTHIVTGSLTVTQGVTASLQGTASFATQALSASFAPPTFPYTGSALITGSLGVSGSTSILAFTSSADSIFTVRNSANTFNIFETRGDVSTIFRRSNNTENTLLVDGTNNYIDLFRPDGAAHRGIRLLKSSSNLNSLEYYTQNSSTNGHFLFKSQPANASGYGTSSPAFVFDVGTTGVTFTAGVGRIHLGNDTPTTLQTAGLGNYTFLIKNGTSPTTSSADNFIIYSADRGGVAGKASPHFRTEDGTVVWLGDESRLFNVTASRTFISSSQNTISGSSLTVYGSGSSQPVFTVQGSQGELFSVTDSLSGSLFSVNDISGLPILEVFSDNTTLMGNYLDPMLITTTKVTQTNSGSFTVYSLPTASYDTAFFEYSIKSGSNARAGTIMAIQAGATVNFTETTTTDIGTTTAISLGVFVTGSNMALTGSSTTGAWTIKAIVRGL